MSDINGQIVQSAAPGALLRTAAEAQAQDPTKSQQPAAQPTSPIRSLTQNPIESTIPTTTPRVLNSGPVQQPSPDFTGIHSLLSSAPVPPPHVAAALIRAMMTPPPSGNGGVLAPKPYVPPTPADNAPATPSQPSGQPATPVGPSQASTPVARPAAPSGGFSPVNTSINRTSVSSAPAASFRSNSSGSLNQPQTRQNLIGNIPFLGGTIGTAGSGLLSRLGNLIKNGGSAAEGDLGAVNNFLDENTPLIQRIAGLFMGGE